MADLSNTAGSAAIKGNEVYGPYGKQRYNQGTHGTPKGFTGQYNDALTGLDYYTTRYYDPVVGVFLSADTVQGNMAGMNPYAYVNGNPETSTDPTGQYYFSPAFILANGLTGGTVPGAGPYQIPPSNPYVGGPLPFLQQHSSFPPTTTVLTPAAPPNVFSTARHSSTTISMTRTSLTSCGTPGPSQPLCGNWGVNFAVYTSTGAELALPGSWSLCPECGEGGGGSNNSQESGLSNDLLASDTEGEASGEAGGAAGDESCSFTAKTVVATDHGERPIGALHTGDKVWAYNPKTHKMELQPIEHVWVHADNDLVDLTLTTTPAHQGKPTTKTREMVHTNRKHPFFTREHGFLPAGQITLGMHVLRADGAYGVVTDWKVVPGSEVMYNLEVAQDHTFTVGVGEWVVHNCGPTLRDDTPVSISDYGFNHSFDRHASEWFGRDVTESDKPAWGDLIRRAMNSKNIFPWSTGSRDTIGVLARLPYYDEVRPFVVQFDRATGELVTAFRPNRAQLQAINALLGR